MLDWLKDETNLTAKLVLGFLKGLGSAGLLLLVFFVASVPRPTKTVSQIKLTIRSAHLEKVNRETVKVSRSSPERTLPKVLTTSLKTENLAAVDAPPAQYIGEFIVENGLLIPKISPRDFDLTDVPRPADRVIATWGDGQKSDELRREAKPQLRDILHNLMRLPGTVGFNSSVIPDEVRERDGMQRRTEFVARGIKQSSREPFVRPQFNQGELMSPKTIPVPLAYPSESSELTRARASTAQDSVAASNFYSTPPLPITRSSELSLDERLQAAYKIADSIRDSWRVNPGPVLGGDAREFVSETGAKILVGTGGALTTNSSGNRDATGSPVVISAAKPATSPVQEKKETQTQDQNPQGGAGVGIASKDGGQDGPPAGSQVLGCLQSERESRQRKLAFRFETESAARCETVFSHEGFDAKTQDASERWILSDNPDEGWKTLYHERNAEKLEILDQRTVKLLEYHAGQAFDLEDGIVYGSVENQLELLPAQLDYRVLYFDGNYRRMTDSKQAKWFVLFGLKPGYQTFVIRDPRNQRQGIAYLPVRPSTATFVALTELERRDVKGYVYTELGQQLSMAQSTVLVSLYGDSKRWEKVSPQGMFKFGEVYSIPESPLFFDVIEAFNPYIARHRVTREEVAPVQFYKISVSQIAKWESSLEGGVSAGTGFVLGIPKSESVRMSLNGAVGWSLGVLSTSISRKQAPPETYVLTQDDRLEAPVGTDPSQESYSVDSRFLSLEVHEGLVFPTAKNSDEAVYQEMRPAQARVVNIVKYDFEPL